MFKSNEAKHTVRVLLQHMFLNTGLLGLRPTPGQISHPQFACVDTQAAKKFAYLELGYDPFIKCYTEARSQRSFYALGTSYIFLCDFFFHLESRPTEDHCPTTYNNRFAGSQRFFHQKYQLYRLVYELARFYLGGNALDAKSNPIEKFDWNDCVFKLNMLDSVLNPTNMELYIACESSV